MLYIGKAKSNARKLNLKMAPRKAPILTPNKKPVIIRSVFLLSRPITVWVVQSRVAGSGRKPKNKIAPASSEISNPRRINRIPKPIPMYCPKHRVQMNILCPDTFKRQVRFNWHGGWCDVIKKIIEGSIFDSLSILE